MMINHLQAQTGMHIEYYTLLPITCKLVQLLPVPSCQTNYTDAFIHMSLDQPRAQALTKYMRQRDSRPQPRSWCQPGQGRGRQ